MRTGFVRLTSAPAPELKQIPRVYKRHMGEVGRKAESVVGQWTQPNAQVREWHREPQDCYDIPEGGGLLACELLTAFGRFAPGCTCGNQRRPTSDRGMEVITAGMRLIEDLAIDTGGVGLINVCLDKSDVPAYRKTSLDRLFNRINAAVSGEGGYAFVIIAGGEEEMAVRLYRRLRNYNPVPTHNGPCEDGWRTRNVPIVRVIGGPAFRRAAFDPLLQVAGLVAHALLWWEEPPLSGPDGVGLSRAFGILDRALNRKASRTDPQGVVTR